MATLAERDKSKDLPCDDCGRSLWRIHPEAKFELQWDHTNKEDAIHCRASRQRGWPVPSSEALIQLLNAARDEIRVLKSQVCSLKAGQTEPWHGKAQDGR